jgi:hypothetical protein
VPRGGPACGTAIASLLVGNNGSRVPGVLPAAELFAAAIVRLIDGGKGGQPLAPTSDDQAGFLQLAAQSVNAVDFSSVGRRVPAPAFSMAQHGAADPISTMARFPCG